MGRIGTGESAEAHFVKQADKVETYLQSREYAAAGPDRSVASFAAEVASVITAPGLVALRDAIAKLDVDGDREAPGTRRGDAADSAPM